MTQDEIIEMARQVGYNSFEALKWEQTLTDFAKLVAAKEREACALIADTSVDYWVKAGYPESAEAREAMTIAEDIRDRGQE